MKTLLISTAILALAAPVFALDGQIGIHDPSTVVLCNGKYYTYGTGGTPLVSDDGWTWRTGTRASRTGAAPDVMKVGDRYFQPISGVTMIWSKSLDPESPDYKWEDVGRIAGLDSDVDVNPIDPCLFIDPKDGKLWMSYGSYVGYLQLVELDKNTGARVQPPVKPINIAINCEASAIIYNDGWYYLLATHGSCCAGSSSMYQTRMGRSKQVTGPYIDNQGIDMLKGGGKLFAGSIDRVVGPGHFGLLECGDGVQKWSCHYEADLDRGGSSVIDIRPLVWKDGWPVAGENVKAGTYDIASVNAKNSLTVAADGTVSLSPYTQKEQQKLAIAPAPGAGGYPGSPYFKVTVGNRVLAANEKGELVSVTEFTGAPEQCWRIEQISDGSYRIMVKPGGKVKDPLALSVASGNSLSLAKYDQNSDKFRWLLNDPVPSKFVKDGVYEIESVRVGNALELAVEGAPVGGGRNRGAGAGGMRRGGAGAPGAAPAVNPAVPAGQVAPAAGAEAGAGRGAARGGGMGMGGMGGRGGGAPVPSQDAAAVSAAWPAGTVGVRLFPNLLQAQQKWAITQVPGGSADSPYYKICVAGTDRTLTATKDMELEAQPSFTGEPAQLWKIEKLSDGTYRIVSKLGDQLPQPLAISAIGYAMPTLSNYNPDGEKHRWVLRKAL